MEGNKHMEYVNLGKSGIKVSRFSYGNWVNSKEDPDAQTKANLLIKTAWENGVNYFDTAEAYDSGQGERQVGIGLKELNVPRSDYVVSTKIFWGKFPENTNRHNSFGTSRKRLIEGLNRSLKNLQMEYVDVVFCHRYDEDTPTLEVCQAMKAIIAQGKAFYWATSAWPAVRIMEAILLCDSIGAPRPIADQCHYNMLNRDSIEKDYRVFFKAYGYGTTIWSPLASGILTGKYNNGIPEGTRLSSDRYKWIYDKYFKGDDKEKNLKLFQGLGDIAKKVGCTQTQLALGWTLKSQDVTTCILGATKVDQLLENLKTMEYLDKITPEILEEIEVVLGNRPESPKDYRNSSTVPKRR